MSGPEYLVRVVEGATILSTIATKRPGVHLMRALDDRAHWLRPRRAKISLEGRVLLDVRFDKIPVVLASDPKGRVLEKAELAQLIWAGRPDWKVLTYDEYRSNNEPSVGALVVVPDKHPDCRRIAKWRPAGNESPWFLAPADDGADHTAAQRKAAERARGRRLNAILKDPSAEAELDRLIARYGTERAAIESALLYSAGRPLPPNKG